MRRRRRSSSAGRILFILIGAVFGFNALCCACGMVFNGLGLLAPSRLAEEAAAGPTLTIAYSPEKAVLFTELVDRFNAERFQTPDGETMVVRPVKMAAEDMIQGAVDGKFQAMTPDSSLWLDAVDRAWMDKTNGQSPLVGEVSRYAVSPVVIAMWEDVARSLGYPDKSLGWQDILSKAQNDPNFKWSHPSTGSASGLLATLAEFYAGAGKTRGLTKEDVQRQSTLDYVAAIEGTVRYYGEGELAVIKRALEEGRSYLDAFVVQEQLVVYFNQQKRQPKLVAIYPVEGTLWEDHPLALLETPSLSADQRQVFSRFRDYVTSHEAQMLVLEQGYRPADLSIPLDDPASPLTAANGVDPNQPQTALQMPTPGVVEVVRDVWWYTKRHTNVYLVVDTSGSMRGEKLANAQEALRVFIEQIRGDRERVGMVEFSSRVYNVMPLDELGNNRAALLYEIDRLEANGDTALLDAIDHAHSKLQELGDRERINAIVVMTDGKENNSRIRLKELTQKLQQANERGTPVVVFCIAYGNNADMDTLQRIAEASGGQVRQGDLATIRDLYKILSTYF